MLKEQHTTIANFRGGDIYLWNNSISKPLIISGSTDGDGDTTTTSGAQTHGAGLSSGDVNVFPVTSGISKLSSLSVEGKTGYVSAEKLKFQLWANDFPYGNKFYQNHSAKCNLPSQPERVYKRWHP